MPSFPPCFWPCGHFTHWSHSLLMWERGNWFLNVFHVSHGNSKMRNIPIMRGQMEQSLHWDLTIKHFITSFKTENAPKIVGMGSRAKVHWSLRSWSLELRDPSHCLRQEQGSWGAQRVAPAPSIWHLPRDRLNLGWNEAHKGFGRSYDWNRTWLWRAGDQHCCGRAGEGLLGPGGLNGVLGQGKSEVVLGGE